MCMEQKLSTDEEEYRQSMKNKGFEKFAYENRNNGHPPWICTRPFPTPHQNCSRLRKFTDLIFYLFGMRRHDVNSFEYKKWD